MLHYTVYFINDMLCRVSVILKISSKDRNRERKKMSNKLL